MTLTLTLGYSPCPNDTFIFDALVHRRIPLGDLHFRERLEDVETLNALALAGTLDMTKISYHALGHLRREYALLRAGGALGRGCGPLVVAREAGDMASLRERTIAIPGRLTTANLLLQLYGKGFERVAIMPFDRIMAAVAGGEVAAGVIIHESRFTYPALGLHKILDLGQWWEETTGRPIPLGGILIKRSLGPALIREVDEALRRSVEFAFAQPERSRSYIKEHAQELADTVVASHIGLYVNPFSLDLGEEGLAAVENLLAQAEARGLIPPCELPLFGY
ncbi:1,4-dihydroxy-6-naphthoate synthase [Trichloromonas sp.]|uniref:1,4-dihydroxy-6-naphthoate synthase n=1 Tax=Trichloromonas sp. TaxID=3069249 RepID=UPI002A3F6F60|nr:1,4-dihydroxy-6-naphthoate synthase [Trichloromonas sp.]